MTYATKLLSPPHLLSDLSETLTLIYEPSTRGLDQIALAAVVQFKSINKSRRAKFMEDLTALLERYS
ncbi:hypothetical protein SCOR_10115 [Sulfidibacter corallicola]|uniref:Uncharacterized protein n=1 Tax=Sulfidibacter corallicola TaxID=2818388 RepID=A0A8A4TFH1_SULCO|nr:hypothetical protein [Sulfidibacter corallicola]QTD48300.1 hypothetical protein J3U87_22200 [Sulfidibacter corallicola]